MPIQMVGAQIRTANQLNYAKDPEGEAARSSGAIGSGVGDVITASDERTNHQHDHFVRTADGDVRESRHGGGIASWLGVGMDDLFGRSSDETAYTGGPTEDGPATPGGASAAPQDLGLAPEHSVDTVE